MWRSSFDLCQFQWLYYCECVFQCVSGIWFLLKTTFNRQGTRFYYGWDNAEQIDSKFWKTRRIKVALRRREDIAIKKERQGNLFSLSCVLRLAASPSVLFDNGKLLAPPVDVDLSCPARIWDGGWVQSILMHKTQMAVVFLFSFFLWWKGKVLHGSESVERCKKTFTVIYLRKWRFTYYLRQHMTIKLSFFYRKSLWITVFFTKLL